MEQECGDGWTASVHPDDLARRFETYVSAFEKRQPFTIEYRLRRWDGDFRWIRAKSFPRQGPDGSFDGYIGWCIDISDEKNSELARQELASRFLDGQEAERARIARELHDDIGQSLAVLSVEMARAGRPISGVPERKHPDIPQLCKKAQSIAAKVSRLSHQLHSSKLEFLGLAKAIRGHCREFSEEHKLPVECSCENIPAELDGAVGLCLLRVVQEALHNCAKHSHATQVKVELAGSANELTLNISDNGVGFDVVQSRLAAGIGLISMRERVHMAGGEFTVYSSPGEGAKISARVPLAARTMGG